MKNYLFYTTTDSEACLFLRKKKKSKLRFAKKLEAAKSGGIISQPCVKAKFRLTVTVTPNPSSSQSQDTVTSDTSG